MPRHAGTPEIVRAVIAAAGEQAALDLVAAFAGQRVYLTTQRLACVLTGGEPAARKILASIGAGVVEIPKWAARHTRRRDAEIVSASAAGESCPDIAARHGITERHVRRIVSATTRSTTKRVRTMKDESATRTLRAIGNIHHNGAVLRAGDTFEAGAALAEALLSSGAAIDSSEHWAPDTLPSRPWIGPHSGLRRVVAQSPSVVDWLEANNEYSVLRRGCELTDAEAMLAAEEWNQHTVQQQCRMFASLDDSISDQRAKSRHLVQA